MFGLADSFSPSLEAVHPAATVSKRFESWLKRACKNFDKLLELKAIADHTLRRERLKELTGDERNRLLDAIEKYDKLVDALGKLVKSKAYEDFRGWSGNEDLIKWVGEERLSVGYCGVWERGKQYLLMDVPLEYDLPYEKKVADLLGLYRVAVYLRIPTQEEAERSLLEFLEWVKKWPRDRVVWAVKNLYPLSDKTGGFWSVVTKVLALESLKEAWESIIEGWTREIIDELKRTAQFEVLKTVLMGEYEAERYVEREIIPKLKEEFLQKYGETTQDPAWVRATFSERAIEVFMERVPVEAEIVEVYEQIKPLIPPGKVELTRAGLWEAIRWAFLHPEMSLDAFASVHVFPLDFTTEEARAIGSKILDKVAKKPPVVAPPPPPPPPVVLPVVPFEERVEKLISALKDQTGIFSWETIERNYGLSFTDDERDRIKRYWTGRFPPNTEITVQWGITIPPPKIPVVAPPVVIPPVPVPVKVVLKPEERGRLADFFFIVKLTRAGVPVPWEYRPEFEKALDAAKTYDENLAILEKVADNIIKRTVAPTPI